MNPISIRTLDCGMPLVVERMSGVRSASLSWLLPAGCITDPDDIEGVTPMLEEMLLRGSGPRDSRDEADLFDALGTIRDVEAGTYTLRLAATCVATTLSDVLAPLTDIILRPRMDNDAIEPCRELCLQSIESLRDDPQQRASLLARARHHPKPLNRSGMGTVEGLNKVSRHDLVTHWQRFARPAQAICAVAGPVDADQIALRLSTLLDGWRGAAPQVLEGTNPARGYAHEQDASTSQVQIIVAYDAPEEPSPTSVLEKLAVGVLSGGMSGRLFSEVREKRGLCYAVAAGYRGDKSFGGVSAYVGTTPERAQESLSVLLAELHRITTPAGRVTPEEFHRSKIGLKSSLVFSGESTSARAGTLAADMRRLGRPRSLEEAAAEVEAVTIDQLNAYLAQRKLGTMTIQTLGPAALRV